MFRHRAGVGFGNVCVRDKERFLPHVGNIVRNIAVADAPFRLADDKEHSVLVPQLLRLTAEHFGGIDLQPLQKLLAGVDDGLSEHVDRSARIAAVVKRVIRAVTLG